MSVFPRIPFRENTDASAVIGRDRFATTKPRWRGFVFDRGGGI